MNVQLFPLLLSASMAITAITPDMPGAAIVAYPNAGIVTASNDLPCANEVTEMPDFAWEETAYDFGAIKHKEPVTHEFRFRNNGSEPLIITSVQASCGCTVAKYSTDPIMPGGEGFVTATYSAATLGVFNKTVTVNANTQDKAVVLSIRGEVR
ncbi:DUF1573 domain-containing protein [Chryseolinea sp. T2]|uniref:DUF1573 domain-containing protein n=1 Tax=Chryseolinea sp. T2 TaxID=3129255 RepID=UPI003077819D